MTLRELYQLPVGERLTVLNKIRHETGAIPTEFIHIYEILEADRIRGLKSADFIKSKTEWCQLYPDFRSISDTMGDFLTKAELVEFRKNCPPPSILLEATSVYKKCISFKEKFTKKIQKNLNFSHTTPVMFYARARYCIDKEKVYLFLNQYQKWYGELHPFWNKVYYETSDFVHNSGYDRLGWGHYIRHLDSLRRKADVIKDLRDKVVGLLYEGKFLINKLDKDISLEYEAHGFEMSLYERELEIAQMSDEDNLPDEAYCYVYTLECDLFVFYVGIAADPSVRFEEHVRGAFSDESHLFKSKFIQKYHSQVRWKVVYEGTRGECKKFERDYIAQHLPLGNMTEGGEG